MRSTHALCVLSLLAAVAVDAGAEMRADGQAGAAALEFPGVAGAIVPMPRIDAAQLLPPGIRPAAERARLSFARGSDAGGEAARLLEVIAADSDDAWVEVDYTIDPLLDADVARVLEAGGVELGHVILMDPATGEVLSYVSTDPERFPATRPYPTASLMKVVTAAAVLRNAPQAADRECRYAGSPYALDSARLEPPAEGGASGALRQSLAISNNQCFARFAVHDLGEEALVEEIAAVGLLDAPGARHAAGTLQAVETRLDLGELGSGLAGSFITPLGAVRLAALLVDGLLVEPYWIAGMRDARGHPLPLPPRAAPHRIWSPKLAGALRELTVEVTAAGTARRAFHDGAGRPLLGPVRVAGKTGTLSGTNPPGRYQWFIGVAPADDPKLAIAAVVVNDAGSARASAARIAAETLREIFCVDGACDAAGVERLHARARARTEQLQREQQLAALAEATLLDAPPRPLGAARLDIPRRLRRQHVDGEIVLMVHLDPTGRVLDARVESSDLPDFEELVLREVRDWQFSPPLQQGRSVEAVARLPIPIQIR